MKHRICLPDGQDKPGLTHGRRHRLADLSSDRVHVDNVDRFEDAAQQDKNQQNRLPDVLINTLWLKRR